MPTSGETLREPSSASTGVQHLSSGTSAADDVRAVNVVAISCDLHANRDAGGFPKHCDTCTDRAKCGLRRG